jgi:hypothetical protein
MVEGGYAFVNAYPFFTVRVKKECHRPEKAGTPFFSRNL